MLQYTAVILPALFYGIIIIPFILIVKCCKDPANTFLHIMENLFLEIFVLNYLILNNAML